MLPLLLAETAPMQVPASYQGITVVALGGVVIVGLTAGVVLAGFQRLRTALATEMKREIEASAKAFQVRVQSPLVVTAEEKFADASSLTAVKDEVDHLRNEVRDGFSKLNDERRTSVGNLHGKIDAVATHTASLSGEVRLLNQQVQQLVTTLLNRQAK